MYFSGGGALIDSLTLIYSLTLKLDSPIQVLNAFKVHLIVCIGPNRMWITEPLLHIEKAIHNIDHMGQSYTWHLLQAWVY